MATLPEHNPGTFTFNPFFQTLTYYLPNLHLNNIADIKRSMDLLVVKLQKHQIKNVVLVPTYTAVTVNDDTFSLILKYFSIGLKQAQVQKLARLPFKTAALEEKASLRFETIGQMLYPCFKMKDFGSINDVQSWLTASHEAPAPAVQEYQLACV